jgi:hypothetical protein
MFHQPVPYLALPLRQLISRLDTEVIIIKNNQAKNIDVLIGINVRVELWGDGANNAVRLEFLNSLR